MSRVVAVKPTADRVSGMCRPWGRPARRAGFAIREDIAANLNADGVESLKPFAPQPSRFCVFEYIYFSRPDSVVEGSSVYEARKRIGGLLKRLSALEIDP